MIFRTIAGAMLATIAFSGASQAGTCPGRPEALGTARTIALDPLEHRKLGLMEYGETLPLEDREVVLTFDDGPIPPSTPKVLDALAAECVKATFFVVGQMARAHPELVRREFQEGHTVGTHSEHHPYLNRLPAEAATKEISGGIASVNKALGGPFAAPFFRFPYLEPKAAQDALALNLGLTIWSTDIHASDWDPLAPAQVAELAMQRLERNRKGILMLHDIHRRTAQAVPLLLRELKARGYSVVHAVPADAAHPKTVASPELWTAGRPLSAAAWAPPPRWLPH
jgi:peptidoglycan/xylan/chitin deacetylase (PgdA/CDA1 family)